MDYSNLELLYLLAAAFGTAILHSVGGFAGALLMAIAVAPVLGVKETVPVVAVAMMISHATRAWLFRKAVDWGAFRMLFLFGFPFIVAGVMFYVDMSDRGVALFLGSFLLVSLPLRRVLSGRSIAVPRPAIAAVAVPYGFLSGTSFGAGMILAPFMLGAGIAGEALLATVAVAGVVLNLTKTIAFGLSPLLTLELAALGAVLGLCTFPGHAVGRWIVRRTSIRVHTVVLETFVAFGAIYMLWKGLMG
ncbi:MAG: sulfite exporter TauE/SafE family protein [Litoreibacter sp.]|nr:sulfite exporter TauE/SafE family protein [Boseongicola sp.]NNK79213.1 sulfite exporter TauE/SafE family protein [Litoreibacter sp.]